MKFERLRASLNNNAQETPTLYMALCSIQSLIYDVEDESGLDIQDCEVGNETMPTTLLWLCNTILDIYNSKKDDMVRNQSRLEDAVKKLGQVEQALAELDEVSGKLEAAQKSLKDKEAALSAAKEDEADYRALCERCREAEAQLSKLSQFDMDTQREKLAGLSAQIAHASEEQKDLRERLQKAEALLDEANREKESLINEITRIDGCRAQAQEAYQKKAAQRELYLEDQQKKEAELVNLEGKLSELTRELGRLQDQVFEYETDKLPAQSKVVEEQSRRAAALEVQRGELAQQEQVLAEKQNALSREIEKAGKDLEEKQRLFEILTADYSEKDKEIKALEQRLSEMRGKTDTEKHAAYKRQLEAEAETLQRIQAECASMKRGLEEQKTRLEEKDEEKNRLTRLKGRADEVEKALDSALAELNPIAGEAFQRRLAHMEQRLNQLSGVRRNLDSSIRLMHEALGTPAEGDRKRMDRLEETMNSMQRSLRKLQKSLRDCANCVSLEEHGL